MPLSTCDNTSTQQAGSEPKIAVFERLKTIHALDYAVRVIGIFYVIIVIIISVTFCGKKRSYLFAAQMD
jgi:hypothetical protein